jgi:spore germination protein YaaH
MKGKYSLLLIVFLLLGCTDTRNVQKGMVTGTAAGQAQEGTVTSTVTGDAQKKTVTGTVRDSASHKPLPGTNILIMGTSMGTTTDTLGHYRIKVPSSKDTLRFAYIGYETKRIPIKGRTTINITWAPKTANRKNLVVCCGGLPEFHSENLFYITNSGSGIESFRKHADQVSIIVPATYHIDKYGVITGGVNPQIMKIAHKHHVKIMPIIASFDQEGIHHLLSDSAAVQRAIKMMVYLAQKNHYDGWQFDLENVNFLDAAAYTAFYRKTANRLHQDGFKISMAVVKTYSPVPLPGNSAYNRWTYENWKGAFQIKKLVKIGDFISFMTYDEHTSLTPPGPVAGYPWMNRMAQYLKSLNVPMDKVSFGIPTYSAYWYPTWSKHKGAHSTHSGISYAHAKRLLKRHHAKLQWMAKQGVHYAHWMMPNGIFNWLFMEDRRSFETKLQFVPEYGFRGISVWVMGMEDPGIWKVLKEHVKTKH